MAAAGSRGGLGILSSKWGAGSGAAASARGWEPAWHIVLPSLKPWGLLVQPH